MEMKEEVFVIKQEDLIIIKDEDFPASETSDDDPVLVVTTEDHGQQQQYFCAHCSYSTKIKRCIRTHADLHLIRNPFVCSRCDYETSTEESLNRHSKVHASDKLLECKQCDYKTVSKHVMKQHLVVHTWETPQTQQCNKTHTSDSSTLRQHLSSCNIEKPSNSESILEKYLLTSPEETQSDGESILKQYLLRDGVEKHQNPKRSTKLKSWCRTCEGIYRRKTSSKFHLKEDDRKFQHTKCCYQTMLQSEPQSHLMSHRNDRLQTVSSVNTSSAGINDGRQFLLELETVPNDRIIFNSIDFLSDLVVEEKVNDFILIE